jgi:hypothetical protein
MMNLKQYGRPNRGASLEFLGGTEEFHGKLQSAKPMYWPEFEQSVCRIQVQRVAATSAS